MYDCAQVLKVLSSSDIDRRIDLSVLRKMVVCVRRVLERWWWHGSIHHGWICARRSTAIVRCEAQQSLSRRLYASASRHRHVYYPARQLCHGLRRSMNLCFDLFHECKVSHRFFWERRNGVGEILDRWKEARWAVVLRFVDIPADRSVWTSVIVEWPAYTGTDLTTRLATICINRWLCFTRCRCWRHLEQVGVVIALRCAA